MREVRRSHPDQLLARTTRKSLLRKMLLGNCLLKFSRAGSPDRPERVYCEQCYLKEVHQSLIGDLSLLRRSGCEGWMGGLMGDLMGGFASHSQ